MKYSSLIFSHVLTICALLICSCEKAENRQMLVSFDALENGNLISKAISPSFSFYWDDQEMIEIYSPTGTEMMTYRLKSVDNSIANASCVFAVDDFALKDGTYYAFYPAVVINTKPDDIHLSFLGQRQIANGNSDHLAKYDYCTSVSSVSNGAGHFSFKHKVSFLKVFINLPIEMAVSKMTLVSKESVFVADAHLNMLNGEMSAVSTSNSISLDFSNTFVGAGQILEGYLIIAPCNLTGDLDIIVESEGGLKYVSSISVDKQFLAGKYYSLEAMSNNSDVKIDSEGTANCYIVSDAGMYSFPTVQGNSADSVGEVASADVLWESFGNDSAPLVGDLINSVSYDSGRIYFVATGKRGNAVIAARNSENVILWSWHIWCTDKPVDQVYNNDAGIMMDRDLGATSARPGDLQSCGLYYEYGRKDPFLGYATKGRVASTIVWPKAEGLPKNRDYVIANPTTYVYYYPASNVSGNPEWRVKDDLNVLVWTSTKSIYDPCPTGYRVPDMDSSSIWKKALQITTTTTFSQFAFVNSLIKGVDFKGLLTDYDTVCWYPAIGQITKGNVTSLGSLIHRWSTDRPNGNSHIAFSVFESGSVSVSSAPYSPVGTPVRCQKIQ